MDSKLFQNLLPEDDSLQFDLHISASIGCEERVHDIIENAENSGVINKQNRSGWTPLMYATCSTNLKVLLFLLEEGAFPDLKNNLGQTALILASKCGSTDAVSLLIDFRANINVKDNKGWSAIFYATTFGHRSVVQLLVEKGAFVDVMDRKDGLSPLMLASAAGHEMIVKDLLLLGLNPTLESKTGETARSLAIKYGHYNIKNLIDAHCYSKKTCRPTMPKVSNSASQLDLLNLLKDLQLSKYYHVFENQGIDLNTFLTLTDGDLKEIGIHLVGPRKKMCLAISRYQNFTKGSSDDKDLLNRLSSENKKLMQQIEQLQLEISQENDLRKIAERDLEHGIMTLQNFTDNVQRTMSYVLILEEKLRQSNLNLKRLLCCSPDVNNEKFKRDIILPLVDGAERLLEDIHHHILVALQGTDFRQ